MGDSITHAGAYQYYINLYLLTRHPELAVTPLNCGIGGDTAEGANARYDWDIAPGHPTVATVMLGMNDVGRDLYGPAGESQSERRRANDLRYRSEMEKLVGRLRADHLRVILLSPSPYDQTARNDTVAPQVGVNDALARYGEFCRELAQRRGCGFVDLNGPMTRMTLEGQRRDPGFSFDPADRVHPSEVGQFVMASLFLQQIHEDREVSRIEVDAAGGRPGPCSRCRIEDLQASPASAAFRCIEEDLPFPVPEPVAQAEVLTGFNTALNQEILRITSLRPGSYQLSIDGKPAGRFEAGELGRGVNLALLPGTPQLAQAREVAATERLRFDLTCRLRTVALLHQFMLRNALPYDGSAAAVEGLRAKLEALRVEGWPYIAAFDRYFAEFKVLRSQGDSVGREVDRLTELERAQARPAWHRYQLERVTP